MASTTFTYDLSRQLYWFQITNDGSTYDAGVKFQTLQFYFKAVNNPSSMRRACMLNAHLLQAIALLKLARGDALVIDTNDLEIKEVL